MIAYLQIHWVPVLAALGVLLIATGLAWPMWRAAGALTRRPSPRAQHRARPVPSWSRGGTGLHRVVARPRPVRTSAVYRSSVSPGPEGVRRADV